jgi:Reverse transcriptase (RNA-dependent DNA polymerase)
LPHERKAIGSKWVFKTKIDEKNRTMRKKARLVAKGFSQKFGSDYNKIFAPVVRSPTFRMLLSVAGGRRYKVKQYDVKTAFLNRTLDEEIYMKQTPGSPSNSQVLRLKKSLYGLKQAAYVWNQTLHESLTNHGCKQNETDNCLYSLTSEGNVVHLLIHVDDILAATDNEKFLDDLMTEVGKDFEMKCLGETKNYLGIELHRDEDGNFSISQPAYINAIIEAAKMKDAKSLKFPMDTGYYKLDGKELETNEEYRKLIGMLMYLSVNSRPDITASVAILSQRIIKPRDTDMNEVKRVIRYLKRTRFAKLRLSASNCQDKMCTFSDADWAEDRRDRKSNRGLICMMNDGTIAWNSRKQGIVSLSSAEAENVALSEACKEAHGSAKSQNISESQTKHH